MPATMMPGGPVADAVFADLVPRIEKLKADGHTPGLATVLVGDDDASARYVGMKMAKAQELGCASPHVHLPQDATTADVIAAVRELNDDDRRRRHARAAPRAAAGRLRRRAHGRRPRQGRRRAAPDQRRSHGAGHPGPGVVHARRASRRCSRTTTIPVAGRDVCILGRGITIGRPLALLLSQKRPTANAAVTVVHTGVPDWPEHTRRADIVVAAAGVPGIVQPEHLTPGCTVVGAGVRYEGRTLLPDVDEACNEVAGPHHATRRRRRARRPSPCCSATSSKPPSARRDRPPVS